MSIVLIALALAAHTPQEERALMCRGPVAAIADDDPGLSLYADIIARSGLAAAKVKLAFDRGEACGDSARNILEGVSVSTIAAAVQAFCDADDDGKECRLLKAVTRPSATSPK